MDSLIDGVFEQQNDGKNELDESELVFRAVRSIVNTIWKKYALEG